MRRRSIAVYDWTLQRLWDECPVACEIAYSAVGELPPNGKHDYIPGSLSVVVTSDNVIRFDHPAFGQEGLLVPRKQLPTQIDAEMMVVRVPLDVLVEAAEICITPPVSDSPAKPWTCNDVARERRLAELGWRK